VGENILPPLYLKRDNEMKTIAITTKIRSSWKIMEIFMTINMLIIFLKIKLKYHQKLKSIK
jgi:hypothetical protein